MRLVTFSKTGETTLRLGAWLDEYIVELNGDTLPPDMLSLLAAGTEGMATVQQAVDDAAGNMERFVEQGLAFDPQAITFLPPVPRPGKMICLGKNYYAHAEEMDNDPPPYPLTFTKFATALVGHRQPITPPVLSEQVDYEGELALVIGKKAKNVAAADAFKYIAGYTIFNDVTARDFQKRISQWQQGKNFDNSSPIGPALVTSDEVPDPQALDLTTQLNGEVMQQGNTSQFIFDIPFVMHYLTQIMTLEPGDIIATGTPGGVGVARDPQVFLKAGDEVRIEITGLGVLKNVVIT